MPRKKKVVYLFGSGATHAVINSLDASKRLLTSDIREKIREKEPAIKDKEIPVDIWNELMDVEVDIEHLISILETNYHYSSATSIRRYYHDAINSLTKEFIKGIDEPLHTPNLYSILFDFHSLKTINEKVISVFTLNYEDLFEKTVSSHLKRNVNYYIDKKREKKENAIPVLKLHGSFNWKNTRPVTIGNSRNVKSEHALWIPPGVDKKKENYPFNILWGKAFEFLMECDTLRVIGCSLSRNDWGLIPMIYTAMRMSGGNPSFDIEIIDFYDKGLKIKEDYSYLSIKTIIDITEFKGYLKDVYTLPSSDIPDYVKENISSDASKKINIFEWWLKAKRFDMTSSGENISTRKKYFENFS